MTDLFAWNNLTALSRTYFISVLVFRQMLIQVPIQVMSPVRATTIKKEVLLCEKVAEKAAEKQSENVCPSDVKGLTPPTNLENTKPKRTGSFALFLRKVGVGYEFCVHKFVCNDRLVSSTHHTLSFKFPHCYCWQKIHSISCR